MIKSFVLMLGFFTRLPVPQIEYSEERYIKGIPLLPFIGCVSGGLLFALARLSRWLSAPLMSVLVFALYLYITGGLHLDGLSDSFDALFSGRDKEKMLEIMKDSRVGSFGVLGLILASAAYLVLFSEVPAPAIFLFPVIGKASPAVCVIAGPYIRPNGMAKLFSENCTKSIAFSSVFVSCGICLIFGLDYFIAAEISIISCVLLTKRVSQRLGGITGDILGLACEMSQIIFLLGVNILKIF